ncbi:ribosome-binding protein 1 [Patagioenas fasciata monilis]|uniref:Ribosome-binding protein 1 n=1 Tax=Patagioenas fasciata monilis TaxID=372326 RepID=A0A1V4KAX2_PATFA|nr:ribosome-binding protein 1 [Patagioenas fasciata monilis]
MKETSYEEALAKQRKELEKTQQQKIEKKKKEKPVEKKGKAKKKEEKPNGKIPEQQLTQEVTDSPKDVVLEPAAVPEPVTVESPVTAVSVAPQEKEKPAPSPKEKRKKEKKVAKVEPAPSPVLASPPVSVPKSSPVLEVTPKEVPVVAILPVGTQQSAPVVSSTSIKKVDALQTHEEQKHEGPVKKRAASKKKSEPAPADSDGPLYLPYKTLVSTVSSMVLSEGEAQQLIEILSEKAGIVQDTWHMATQKGDPVAILKRQLEEKEKQLAAEQEDATAARNKLRELSKVSPAQPSWHLWWLADQASQREVEATLQKRLDEVSDELRKSQSSYKSLLADAEKAKGQQQSIGELQAKLLSSEAEVKNKLLELDNVKGKLQDASSENMKLLERIKSIEALLEAGQMREAEKDRHLQAANEAEMKQLRSRLQEKTDQLSSLEREATELREVLEQQKMKNNDLREKNWKTMEALTTVEKTCDEKLLAITKAKEELAQQLDALQTQTKQALLSALPGITVSSHQDYNTWLQEFKEKTADMLKQQTVTTKPLDSALKLKEAEEAQSTLQAECEQYRTILAETEGMLRDLQKSVEEEEQVWKAKLMVSEEELQKSQLQLKSLEETVEKLKADLQSTDQLKEYTSLLERQLENHLETASSERQNYTKEVEALRQLLSQSQEQLEAAKMETQKQSKELTLLKTQLEQNETLVENEKVLRQKLALELEEAQSSACSLQAELEKLRLAENAAASDVEEIQHLKERLEKEKKLTRDLGQAATKLQELLKVTQDQLAKEKETVKKLKEQLQETGEEDSLKEGTSV